MKMIFSKYRLARRSLLITIFTLILVYAMGSLVFINNLYQENFPRYDKPRTGYLRFTDVPNYARKTVTFQSGKNKLAGYLFGEDNRRGLVVISPGRGEGAEFYLAQTLYFVDRGWRVFSFDNTGTYASEGINSIGLPQSRIDLEAALTYIHSNNTVNQLPVMLWGHSWGGYAVAAVLKDHPDVSAVVSISGFNSPGGLLNEYIRDQLGMIGYLEIPCGWVYQTVRFGRSAGMTAVDGINSSDKPVMIVHDDADEAISYSGASIIAQRGRITNSNAVYVTRHTINGSGHMDVSRSRAAIQYIDQKNQEYKELIERYQGTVPESVKAGFYASVNRFQTSELDADFMHAINSFFESALRTSQ